MSATKQFLLGQMDADKTPLWCSSCGDNLTQDEVDHNRENERTPDFWWCTHCKHGFDKGMAE